MACRGPFRKRKILRVFSHRTCKLLFDTARPLPYTLLFVRDVINLSGAAPEVLEPLSWKGIIFGPGTSKTEWGRKSGRNGAPAPQSRVSLSELKPRELLHLLECVRSFLLVVPPDSQ